MSEAPTAAVAPSNAASVETYWRWIWFEQPAFIREYAVHLSTLPKAFSAVCKQHQFHRVIDASCGFGLTSILLDHYGLDVVGADTCEYSINVGLRLCRQQTGKVFDLRCMPYVDIGVMFGFEYFDAVMFTRLNEITTEEEMRTALQGCWDAIKPGGMLIWQGLGPETDERAAADQLALDTQIMPQHELVALRHRPEVKPHPLRVVHMLTRAVGPDYYDEHHLFLIEPEGQEIQLQCAILRKPYIWHGRRMARLLAEVGFDAFRQIEQKVDGKSVVMNSAVRR